jgi:succinoglycan biosynthesis transport protein ExoP
LRSDCQPAQTPGFAGTVNGSWNEGEEAVKPMQINLHGYMQAARRWWWVMAAAVALAGGAALLFSAGSPPQYAARVTLQVGTSFTSARPDAGQFAVGTAMARYYAELARREATLTQVVARLGLPFSWDVIANRMLATNVVANANLLELTVTDTSPERAALIANALAEQLVQDSPTSPEKIAAERAAIDAQLREAQGRADALKTAREQLVRQRDRATSASDLAEINGKLDQLDVALQQEQSSIQALLGLQQSGTANSLGIFERATPPAAPLPDKRPVLVATAALAGLFLATLAIFLLAWIDDRWHAPRELEIAFSLPSLGKLPGDEPTIAASTSAARQARAQAAYDTYTNILLAAPPAGIRSLLVSSPRPTAERTGLSIDLAQLFARAGYRVVLVDTDEAGALRNHPLLTLPRHSATRWMVVPSARRGEFWLNLHGTAIPNVRLLHGPLGEASGLPTMLPELRWPKLLELLHTAADVIIFDGPSALSGVDATLLAEHVDGAVLALNAERDTRTDVQHSRERLTHRPGSRLLGAVLLAPEHPTAPAPRRRLPGLIRRARHATRAPAALPAQSVLELQAAPSGPRPAIRSYHTRLLQLDDEMLLRSLLSV